MNKLYHITFHRTNGNIWTETIDNPTTMELAELIQQIVCDGNVIISVTTDPELRLPEKVFTTNDICQMGLRFEKKDV